MTIKNPNIIHFIRRNKNFFEGLDDERHRWKYLCIHAVYPTPEKSTRIKSKVTCKNCLNILEKER